MWAIFVFCLSLSSSHQISQFLVISFFEIMPSPVTFLIIIVPELIDVLIMSGLYSYLKLSAFQFWLSTPIKIEWANLLHANLIMSHPWLKPFCAFSLLLESSKRQNWKSNLSFYYFLLHIDIHEKLFDMTWKSQCFQDPKTIHLATDYLISILLFAVIKFKSLFSKKKWMIVYLILLGPLLAHVLHSSLTIKYLVPSLTYDSVR